MPSMDGVLPVYKPENMSSAQLVARVKHCLNVRKAGHTGTLDPFATGLVLVALGKATRISRFLLKSEKTYLATVVLGIQTNTFDRTGQITAKAKPSQMTGISAEQVQRAASSFLGIQEQVAPSFSALKHRGQPLYKLARKGVMVTKPPRTIHISKIEITRMDLPEFDILVQSSAGTYIRSLAHDLGQYLGCGAHLKELVRLGSGHFTLDGAITLEEVFSHDSAYRDEFQKLAQTYLVSMSESLSFFPKIIATENTAKKVSYGQPIHLSEISFSPSEYLGTDHFFFRLVDEKNHLLAVVSLEKNSDQFAYSCVLV